jgi:antitoxin component of MazEF toxin-antitoxin module
MTVIVKKVGGSVAVVIPKAMARDMNLTDGTPLDITSNSDTIVMRRAARRPRRSLSKLVKQINPKAYGRRRAEFLGDAPVGKEMW